MIKTVGLAVASALMSTAAIASAHAETVDVTIDGGLAQLAGTLVVPDSTEPIPAVLIIAGSGPTDRNGNQLPAIAAGTLQLDTRIYLRC